MIKTKVAFLEGRLLSSQSEESEKFSKSPDLAGKEPDFQTSHFWFNHANRLYYMVLLIAIQSLIFGNLFHLN